MDTFELAPATLKVESDVSDFLNSSEPGFDEGQSKSRHSCSGGTTNNSPASVETCADFSDEEYFIKTEVDCDSINDSNDNIIQSSVPLHQGTTVTADRIIQSRVPLPEEATVAANPAFVETGILFSSDANVEDFSASQGSEDPLACPEGDVSERRSTRVRRLPKKLAEAEDNSHRTVIKLRKMSDLVDVGKVNSLNYESQMLSLHKTFLRCRFCDAGFPSSEILQKHLKEIHGSYSFDQCLNVFDSVASSQEHSNKCLTDKFNGFQRKSGEAVASNTLLKSDHPSNSFRMFKCNKPQVQNTQLLCDNCFRPFHPFHLTRHMRVCQGEQLVSVPSLISNDTPFCAVQGKITQGFNLLIQETDDELTGHPELPPTNDAPSPSNHCLVYQGAENFVRPYSCPKCSRSFRLSDSLKLHLRGDCSGKIILSPKKATVNRISSSVDESTISRGKEPKTVQVTLERLSLEQIKASSMPENSMRTRNTAPASSKDQRFKRIGKSTQVGSTEVLKCHKCSSQFQSVLRLNRHLRVCGGEKLVDVPLPVSSNAPFCAAEGKITQGSNLSLQESDGKCASTRQSSRTSNGNLQISRHTKECACRKCSENVKVKTQLKSRLRSQSKTSIKNKKQLEMRSKNSSDIERPSLSHRPAVAGKEYLCPQCPEKFSCKTGLNSHLRSHTNKSKTGEKKMKTGLKGVVKLKSKGSLSSNSNSSARRKRRYPCPKCPEEFSFKTRLNSHLRFHTRKDKKAEKHKLAELSKKFRHKSALGFKSKSLFSRKRRGSHACLFCSEVFPYKKLLGWHYKKVHPLERPYMCQLCPSKFADVKVFRNHKKTVHGERKYECDECKARFKSKVGIRNHLKRHVKSPAKPFICTKCPAAFRAKGNLTKHLMWVHDLNFVPPRKEVPSIEKCFKCLYCPRWYLSQSALTMHLNKKHFNENPFSCSKCSLSFGHALHLKLHERNNCNAKPVKCTQCPKVCLSPHGLKMHQFQKHPEIILECPKCKKKFGFQKRLDAHIRQVHSGLSLYCCPDCPLTFRSAQTLGRHSYKHTGKHPYLCEICAAGFATVTRLRTHMVTHGEDRMFKCDLCSAKFKSKPNLQTHLDCHADKRKFSCKLCPMKFRTPAHLRQHSVKHSGERPFKCEVCPKTFGQLSTLKRHKMRHTGEKPFACDLCSACFVQKGNLQTHMKVHLNEKPYKCTECSQSFRQKGHLQVHERKHKAERPFQCPLCKAQFRQEGNLSTHMKKKHSKTGSESEEEQIELERELKFLEDSFAVTVEFRTLSDSEAEGLDSSL